MDKTLESVKSNKKTPSDQTTQKYLPFSEIRDNMLIMKDGSARMVLKVKAVNFNLKSEEEQDSIIYSYQRFLNSLRFPIQIVVRSLKVDIDTYISKLKTLAVKQTNPLLQEQAYKYIDFLVNLVDLAQIMRKDFYIIVPYDSTENKSVRNTGLVGVFQNFWSAITHEENIGTIRERRRKIDDLRKQMHERLMIVKSSLETIWIKSEEVQKDDLIRYIMNYYNPKMNFDIKIRDSINNINIES